MSLIIHDGVKHRAIEVCCDEPKAECGIILVRACDSSKAYISLYAEGWHAGKISGYDNLRKLAKAILAEVGE